MLLSSMAKAPFWKVIDCGRPLKEWEEPDALDFA
jgi:hypothetical protein